MCSCCAHKTLGIKRETWNNLEQKQNLCMYSIGEEGLEQLMMYYRIYNVLPIVMKPRDKNYYPFIKSTVYSILRHFIHVIQKKHSFYNCVLSLIVLNVPKYILAR